jgi:hypothetical protein
LLEATREVNHQKSVTERLSGLALFLVHLLRERLIAEVLTRRCTLTASLKLNLDKAFQPIWHFFALISAQPLSQICLILVFSPKLGQRRFLGTIVPVDPVT